MNKCGRKPRPKINISELSDADVVDKLRELHSLGDYEYGKYLKRINRISGRLYEEAMHLLLGLASVTGDANSRVSTMGHCKQRKVPYRQ